MADLNIELFYRFTRLDTGVDVIVKRAPNAGPVITAGGGRWNIVNRPRRGGFTTYDGDDPYRMDVPIFFDGFDTGRSMEDAISILNQMNFAPADYATPPQVRIEGAVPVKNATWVLDPQITWGDQLTIWNKNNYRLRQDCVVHLLQYVVADQLQIKPPATSRIYNVKDGDTLKSISKDQYGTPNYWSTIKNANSIRDPKKLPKTLRIPVVVGK